MGFGPGRPFDAARSGEVPAHISAGAAWDKQFALIPDPVNYDDYRQLDPSDVVGLLRQRASQGRLPCERTTRRWPKGFDDRRYRLLTHLDSLDQLGLRMAIAPAIPWIERALGPEVVAHRSEDAHGAWTSQGVRAGAQHRRRLLAQVRAERPEVWLGITDVERHYPTTTPAALLRVLHSALTPTSAVERVAGVLESLHGLPGGVTGLPVGPEFSGPLATIGLLPVDRRLRAEGVSFVRLVDDIWVFAANQRTAIEALDVVNRQLLLLGQRETSPSGVWWRPMTSMKR